MPDSHQYSDGLGKSSAILRRKSDKVKVNRHRDPAPLRPEGCGAAHSAAAPSLACWGAFLKGARSISIQNRNGANLAAEPCRGLWLEVCRSRATPLPDLSEVARFLAQLTEEVRSQLEQALLLCLKGQEKHHELKVVSWAAACTRPAYVAQVRSRGVCCTGPALFAAGLALIAEGWDMSARVAQLAGNPPDIEALRALLALQAVQAQWDDEAIEAAQADDLPASGAGSGLSSPLGLEDDQSRARLQAVPVEAALSERGAQEYGDADPNGELEASDHESPRTPARPQLKLYGKEAAHTLESGPHGRGAGFMGAHVVTIESARAFPGGGYDWGRKLSVQLTPEEMPAAIAVLMNLAESVRFAQHGARRDKFIELRRQAGGLVVVTGQGGSVYAVPVKLGALYYLLALFARAMAQGLPGPSPAEVLALVRASQ